MIRAFALDWDMFIYARYSRISSSTSTSQHKHQHNIKHKKYKRQKQHNTTTTPHNITKTQHHHNTTQHHKNTKNPKTPKITNLPKITKTLKSHSMQINTRKISTYITQQTTITITPKVHTTRDLRLHTPISWTSFTARATRQSLHNKQKVTIGLGLLNVAFIKR